MKLGTIYEISKKLNTDRDGVMAWAKVQGRYRFERILTDLIYTRILEPSIKHHSHHYAYTLLEDPRY